MRWTAEKIKALRDQYGETQEAFSERIGVAVHTLRWWEQAKGNAPLIAERLLDRLKQDIAKQPA